MKVKKMRVLKKLGKIVLLVFVMVGLTLSSWPFDIPEVHAATVVLTSADTSPWDVPSDWNDTNTIEVVGAGGGGGGGGSGGSQAPAGGGGGGAYSTISNLDLTPGGTATFQVGAGGPGGSGTGDGTTGTDTIFNGTGTTCSAQSICAKGGVGGQSDASGGGGGAGGDDATSIGTTKRVGGAGAAAGATLGSGGGGAAGDTGVGGAASTTTGGAGGGSGAAGGGTTNNAGTDGTEWTTGGSGGGGGGGDKADGGAGGNDGGGGGGADNGKIGGAGAEGVIVITYTPIAFASFTQANYQWMVDDDALALADNPWSDNAGVDLAENTAITVTPVINDPPDTTQNLRLRVNFTVGTANLTASETRFKLQYRTGTDSDCSTGTWADVNTGNDWVYFNAPGITDGATLTSTILGSTDVLESYVESRPSPLNPNSATFSPAQDIEYDFNIVGTNSSSATRYLFRAVETDGAGTGTTPFAGYTNCAILSTEPGTGDLMRHGATLNEGVDHGFFWAD